MSIIFFIPIPCSPDSCFLDVIKLSPALIIKLSCVLLTDIITDSPSNKNFNLIAIKDSLPMFSKYYMNDFEYNIIKNGNIFKKYLPGYQLMIDKEGNEIGLYQGDEENKVTRCIRMF